MKKQTYRSIDPANISVGEMHRHLLSAVAPRPIALASTIDQEGRINLSPFSFFNVFSANPPVMIFSPSRRGRDNTTKDTYDNLKEIPEVVINVVNYPIVQQVSLSSTEYERGVNEFVKSGLTSVPSELIRPPRVAESPVSFECRVDDIIELGRQGGAGNLVISRVVKMHMNEKYLDENGNLDTRKLDLVGRMGEMWYTRASGEALFEIDKPIGPQGIGVDALPEHVRLSTILSGNDLGRLGNMKSLPTSKEIEELKYNYALSGVLQSRDILKVHQTARDLINQNQLWDALRLLVSISF